jgi:hypothetical protein
MKITGAGAGEQCRTMFGLPHNSVAVSAVLMHIPLPHPACAASDNVRTATQQCGSFRCADAHSTAPPSMRSMVPVIPLPGAFHRAPLMHVPPLADWWRSVWIWHQRVMETCRYTYVNNLMTMRNIHGFLSHKPDKVSISTL